MNFYRLIKPDWARPLLGNGEPNPDFKEEVQGPNVIEGCNFSNEYLIDKNNEGYNVYFFPNHPSKDVYAEGLKHLNGKVIDVFNYVFVDMDLKDGVYKSKEDFLRTIDQFPLKPTMTVDSGNGIHAYWRVSDLTRESYILTQRALLKHFNTDKSVWTVLQLMRLPGLNNTKKYRQPKPSVVLDAQSSNEAYRISDIPATIYEHITEEDTHKVQSHIDRIEGRATVSLGQDVNIDELPEEFLELLAENDSVCEMFNTPTGDRSAVDMKLANLLFKKDFDRKQAITVIANTQKALERGAGRMSYACHTVDKVYDGRSECRYQTVTEKIRSGKTKIEREQVYGPSYLDYAQLGKPWRRQELLGIIAGSGVGKTAFALNIVKEIIQNNPDNDDVFVFFTIEMPEQQIIERWISLVGENSPLTDRLYVIGNQDEKGMPMNIGLQEIYEACSSIKKDTGRKIGSFIIDHFHIISSHINVNKQPNFGIGAEQDTGWGDVQNLSTNQLATQLKSLAKLLDSFGIILSQTTKGKGVGDLPVGKDGSYNNSQYEWIMDRIITIWQPLMRVQNRTDLKFLSWQYVKLREKHKDDRVHEQQPYLLKYDMLSGSLSIPTSEEYQVFKHLLPEANSIREAERKNKNETNRYSIQVDLNDVSRSLNKLRAVT